MSINLELHLSKNCLKFIFVYKKSVMSDGNMMENDGNIALRRSVYSKIYSDRFREDN